MYNYEAQTESPILYIHDKIYSDILTAIS